MRTLEAVRRSFRPDRIDALFVMDSVPRDAKFFYDRSGTLYRAMERCFDTDDLLRSFEESGFYLDHIAPEPLGPLPPAERRALLHSYLPSFTQRLRTYRPAAVVVLMRGILPLVRSAMTGAGLLFEPFCTAFPSHGNQARFHAEMTAILPQLGTP